MAGPFWSSPGHLPFRSLQAPISMRVGTGLTSAQFTLLSRLSATGGATNCQGLFLFGFHGYIMQACLKTRCSIVTSAKVKTRVDF